jgi:hypothetical protein
MPITLSSLLHITFAITLSSLLHITFLPKIRRNTAITVQYYVLHSSKTGRQGPIAPASLHSRYVIRNISKYWTKNDSITTITTNYYMITTNYSYWKLVPLLIPTVTTNYCIITTYYFHHYYQLLHHYYILLKIKVKIGANHYDVILQFTTYYLFFDKESNM